MKDFFNSLLNLVFPPKCEVCKKDTPEPLCTDCFSQIQFMKPSLGIYSAGSYEGVLRSAIHRFKFAGRKSLATPLGILLVKYLSHTSTLCIEEIDSVIPVPLHRKREQKRGFNQANLLAEVISKYFGLPTEHALERTRDTKPHFNLPRKERFSNIKGAFMVSSRPAVQDKRLLLVDDIYTTGATIFECSKTLKLAGAKRVEI